MFVVAVCCFLILLTSFFFSSFSFSSFSSSFSSPSSLQSLLHIVADCPIQRTLWFFRPTPSTTRTGASGDLRFPLDCSYQTPLLITRWQPPPKLTELRTTKENLRATAPTAQLVPVEAIAGSGSHIEYGKIIENDREGYRQVDTEKVEHGHIVHHTKYIGPKGGIPHGSGWRPETAPDNIQILSGKIIKKHLFLPEGNGIVLYTEKKLRSILYDIRVIVQTELDVVEEDTEVLEEEDIVEEEKVVDGHVTMERIRTRRLLTFHCRELYHGTPLYGTDIVAEKSEIEIFHMLKNNPNWEKKIVNATMKLAVQKNNVYGEVTKVVRELLVKMMDLGNAPGGKYQNHVAFVWTVMISFCLFDFVPIFHACFF